MFIRMYDLISGKTDTELATAINEWIAKGHQPLGGPTTHIGMVDGQPRQVLIQAMVLYEEE